MRLSEIAQIVNGATPSTSHPNYYDGDVVWITPKDLSDQKQKYISSGERNISQEGYNNCSTHLIPAYNILMSSRAPIGLLSINTVECCTNQGFKNLIVDKSKADVDYLYYYLKIHIKEIEALGSGTTFKEVSKVALEKYDIELPSLEEQKKVAKILSTLDRKIALNRSINEELERMAKEIYDHWFVQFDFPDAEGKPYKSSGGRMVYNPVLKREIPEGWKVKRLEEVCDIYNGATPSTKEDDNYGGDIIWITPKDLSDQKSKFTFHGERNITQKGFSSCSTHMLPKGAVLMSSRAPIGLISIAANDLCTNQGFKSLVPRELIDNVFLYYYIKMHIQQIEQLGTGTTFKEVSREDLVKFPILYVSDRKLYQRWYPLIKPIFDKQAMLCHESEELTALRDELLPLLMTGQVGVEGEKHSVEAKLFLNQC